jgi:hypothetical protein
MKLSSYLGAFERELVAQRHLSHVLYFPIDARCLHQNIAVSLGFIGNGK